MLKVAIDDPNLKSVILASLWSFWRIGVSTAAEGALDTRFAEVNRPRLRDGTGVASSLKGNQAILVRGFGELIRSLALAGKKIWILGSIPEPSAWVPKALYIEHIGFHRTDI